MTWGDVDRILLSKDFGDKKKLKEGLSEKYEKDCGLKHMLNRIGKVVSKKSEMDASVRVVLTLLEVLQSLDESVQKRMKIQCQPTVAGHTTFTDFMIVVEHENTLVEVKKKCIYKPCAPESTNCTGVKGSSQAGVMSGYLEMNLEMNFKVYLLKTYIFMFGPLVLTH